jgi:hypothetical protein
VIRPRAPDGTKHVPPENPRPEPGEAELRHVVVDARLAVRLSVHPPPYPSVKSPFHQTGAIDAERVIEILAWAGAVAVNGDREALDAELGHRDSYGRLKSSGTNQTNPPYALTATSIALAARNANRGDR